MKGVYSALVFCLFLSMVAVGLQIAASITQGWKIIEGEHLVQKAPWVSPSQFGMNENDTKHSSIHIGVWKLTFCVGGKCVDVEDYRRDPTALVKYFEGKPSELQALSVFGCMVAAVAIFCFWPLFQVLGQRNNCYAIYVSILLLMSGFSCLALAYIMYHTVADIQEIFEDRTEKIKTNFPYSFILLIIGFAASFTGSLVSSIIICKLNQHIEHEERMRIERERNMTKDDIFSQKVFSKSATNKPAITMKNQEQVVYSIHL